MRHYHASENTPGYLPEAEGAPYFDREQDALAYVESIVASYIDSIEDEAFEAGTSFAKVTIGVAGRGTGYVLVTRSDRMYDLGRAFAVDTCYEDCEAA